MKKALSIIFALLLNSVSWSQNYPIQSTVLISPPYSVYLSDYASISSNKLMVNLMLKDPMEPRVDITLRVTIKGNGIELRTRDDYRPQPLELNGGVPLLLSGPDLESYLNPANLTFSGISKSEFVKTGKLPEGVYQFSVEALSYDRPGVVLSNSGMTIGWLVLNDPPHWTLPMQNSLLTATYPQFVNFSWMPMNTGSPNAAFTTEYEFTIVELWPEDRAPGDAINSFAPLFQTITNNTSLVYGPAEPELTPGRKYVCRLRAYDTEGRDLFKNNGYSEILVFTFGQACLPPNTFTDKIISPDEARVEWATLPGHTQFILSYSEQNPDGTWSNWYHNEGIMPYSNLDDLKPEHKYRYQLKAICGTIESEYSETGEFTMPEADTTEKVCGQGAGVPDIDDSPPLPTLRIGDRIDAGGFTALVTEAEGANGNFSGKCILFVKTFGYAPIYSEFSGIGVNQSMQLTSGSIKSVKGELKIHSMDSIIADLNDMLDDGTDDSRIVSDGDPNVGDPYQPGDTVTVTLGGEEYVITGDTIIITASGDTITTDFSQIPPIIAVNGDTTDVTTDELDFDNPGGGSTGTDDVASNVTDTAAYAIKLVKFRAAKDQFFGFDKYPDDIPQFRADYNMEKVNDQGYKVHWKSAQSNGRNDKVVMEITAEVPDSIRSRLSIESSVSGVLNYSFSPKDSVWEVIVTGKSHEDEDHIIAWYTQDDGSRIAVGHLNMVSYNKQNMKLVIVPVGQKFGFDKKENYQELKDSLNKFYQGAITFWDVSIADPLDVDFEDNNIDGLDTDLPDMAAYTREMKNIRNAMKDRDDYDPDAQYLFLVAKSEKGNKNGIMPFRRRYGFIFMEDDGKLKDNKEKLFHTMAHELGHGPFGLEHPWQEKGTTQGATYNLMDYSNKKPDNLLRKYQWHFIHNPKASLLGGDEEETSDVTYYKITPNDLWCQNINMIACAKMNNQTKVGLNSILPGLKGSFEYGAIGEIKFEIPEYAASEKDNVIDLSSQEVSDYTDYQNGVKYAEIVYKSESKKYRVFFHISLEKENEFLAILNSPSKKFFTDLCDDIPTEESQKVYSKLAQLPICGYSEMNLANRKKYLEWLSEEFNTNEDQEKLIIELISTTPPKDKLDLFNYLNTNISRTEKLYEKVDVLRKEFVNALFILYASVKDKTSDVKHVAYAKLGSAVEEDGSQGIYKFYRKKGTTSAEFTSTGIDFILKKKLLSEFEWSLPALIKNQDGEKLFSASPFDIIETELTSIEIGKFYTNVTQKEVAIQLPAIYVKYLLDEQISELTKNELSVLGDAGVNIATFIVGVGELNAGITALKATTNARGIIRLILGSADLLSFGTSNYCEGSASEFCKAYNEYELYINLGLLSGSVLNEVFPKLYNQLKNSYKDVQMSAQERKLFDDIFEGGEAFNQLITKCKNSIITRGYDDITGIVFRGDDVLPETVKLDGFKSWGSNMDIEEHVFYFYKHQSGWVGTSKKGFVGNQFAKVAGDKSGKRMFVYIIDETKLGQKADVNAFINSRDDILYKMAHNHMAEYNRYIDYRWQYEIVAEKEILPEAVIGAFEVNSNYQIIGDFIKF